MKSVHETNSRNMVHMKLGALFCCLFMTAASQADDSGGENALAKKAADEASAHIEVHSGKACTCCSNWIKYMEKSGFSLTDNRVENLQAFKFQNKIPNEARSCHTAFVAGYIVEGHVPASDIEWLLTTRPEIRGLSVPGMVTGPPGMEGPRPQDYSVMIIEQDNTTRILKTYKAEE